MNATLNLFRKIAIGLTIAMGGLNAYAADMQAYDKLMIDEIKRAIDAKAKANSMAEKEKALNTSARAGADCTAMQQSNQKAIQDRVARHVAPDPTKIIETNTCFLDVQSIEIPKTGWGWADSLVKNLIDSTLKKTCDTAKNLVNPPANTVVSTANQTIPSASTGNQVVAVGSTSREFTATPGLALIFWQTPSKITSQADMEIIDRYYKEVTGKSAIAYYMQEHNGAAPVLGFSYVPLVQSSPAQNIATAIVNAFQ